MINTSCSCYRCYLNDNNMLNTSCGIYFNHKCTIFGHVFSRGVEFDPKKMNAIMESHAP